jgi:hypothetical protein
MTPDRLPGAPLNYATPVPADARGLGRARRYAALSVACLIVPAAAVLTGWSGTFYYGTVIASVFGMTLATEAMVLRKQAAAIPMISLAFNALTAIYVVFARG